MTRTWTTEERQLRREKFAKLKQIFEEDCKYPDLPSYNLHKKLQKYKCMEDEYYEWDDSKFMGTEKLADIGEMTDRGYQPGVASTLWEFMAGSGRLSATARAQKITHLPPLDYRWGVNLGHWWHQVVVLWQLLVFPVDVAWGSPTCTPWGANARQWPQEQRTQQRDQESLTLQFLTIIFFVQTLLGKA